MNYRQLPNQLTILRLILAGVFFLVLNQYRYMPDGQSQHAWLLWLAIVIFVFAAVTDALDGMLARRWGVESRFGRIMDPFCDKVLVIGAFIYLAGPRFVDPSAVAAGSYHTMVSGVHPWMVAIILGRELLVTSVRGELEGQGVSFAAMGFGKAKMLLQSIAVPVILGIVWFDPHDPKYLWMWWLCQILVYTTVIVTVLSAWPYIARAKQSVARERHQVTDGK